VESTSKYYGKTLMLIVDGENAVKSLGVGAGGKIIQDIIPDHNDPRIWDVTASKLFNVQLVDSRTFKLVTGLDPPPTPVTPAMYKEMGLPFYQSWREGGKEAGIAGKWGSIMGTKEVASQNLAGHSELEEGSFPLKKSGKWGFHKFGGALGSIHDDEVEAGDSSGGKKLDELSYDFPLVMLDVDDTIQKFRSAVES